MSRSFHVLIRVAWGLSKLSVASGNAPTHIITRAERPFLHSISHVQGSSNKQDPSRLAVEISLIMPEAHKDENATRAQTLLHGSVADVTTERLKILLYQASNKLANSHIDNDTTELLEDSGIIQTPLQLEMIMDTALHSIAESLFQQALKTLYSQQVNISKESMLNGLPSWRVIKWLLSSGQNPNVPIHIGVGKYLTPLELAVDMGCLPLISLLLDTKLNTTPACEDPVDLIQGILQGDLSHTEKTRLLKRFLKDEATISSFKAGRQWRLLANILDDLLPNCEAPSLELIDILIDDEAGIWFKGRDYPSLGWTSSSCNVLGYAAGLITESVAMTCLSHLLSKAQQSEPFLPLASFITPDSLLCTSPHSMDALKSVKNFFTLVFQSTAIPDLNVPQRHYTSQHTAAILKLFSCCTMGADPNWTEHGFTALERALEQTSFEGVADRRKANMVHIATILLDAGAALRGGEIITAVFLNDWHLTSRLLEMAQFGPNQQHDLMLILEAAISNGNQRLIDRLLEMIHLDNSRQDDLMLILEAAVVNDNQHLIDLLLETIHLGTGQQNGLISILGDAIVNGKRQLTTQILTHCPDVYDAGVLCASVLSEDHGSGTVAQLLHNRPRIEDVLPLESLAIGLAAWRKREDLLDLLLAKLQKPSLAVLSEHVIHSLTGSGRVRDFFDEYYTDQLRYHRSMNWAFWRDKPTILGSPLALALVSGNSLSRLLDHGFLPDRLTMSIAANLDRRGPIQKLAQYRMLSGGFEDYEGPLATAVRRNHIDGVRSLLDGNHCVDEDNSHVGVGRNPLQTAVESGHLDLIELLLGAGADVHAPAARALGATALQLAAIKGYIGVAKMLVDLGADVNTPGSRYHGRTALEGAAEHGRIDTIQYILSQGVKTKGEGRISYLRAIRYAELEGHMVAAKLLKTWREWTVDDNVLWGRLRSLSRWECELVIEKVGDDRNLESELESHGLEEVHGGDGMPDIVFDGAPVGEVSARQILDTANVVGGMDSELEALEMMTRDTFVFWSGLGLRVDGV
ncbi:ankyrin repeat containing protein [Colletotrichum asianum]